MIVDIYQSKQHNIEFSSKKTINVYLFIRDGSNVDEVGITADEFLKYGSEYNLIRTISSDDGYLEENIERWEDAIEEKGYFFVCGEALYTVL